MASLCQAVIFCLLMSCEVYLVFPVLSTDSGSSDSTSRLVEVHGYQCGYESYDTQGIPHISVKCDYLNIGPQVPKISQTTDVLITEYLTFEENQLTLIQEGAFSNLSSVVKLDLSHNQIHTIVENAFVRPDGTSTLEVLDLHNNNLKYVPGEAIRRLTKLRILVLSHNQIGDLYIGHTLTELQELALDNNKITTIRSNAFGGLVSLKKLSLHHNQITEIEQNSFTALGSLHGFCFSFNPYPDLSKLLENLRNLPKLADLEIAGCGIQNISENTFANFQLTRLDLSSNSLDETKMPEMALQSLRTTLNELILNHNSFTSKIFDSLKNMQIQSLNLKNNSINGLSNKDFGLLTSRMNNLDISYNNLGDQIKYLSVFRNVVTLNIQNTLLHSIPANLFGNMPLLTKLFLDGNHLMQLTWVHLAGLQYSLQQLTLHNNLLETIDECTVRYLTKLTGLQFDNNPLNCNCTLAWVRDSKLLPEWQKPRCYKPFSLSTYNVRNYPIDNCNSSNSECSYILSSSIPPVSTTEEVQTTTTTVNTPLGNEQNDLNTTTIIVVCVVCATVLIVLGAVIALVCWRRKSGTTTTAHPTSESHQIDYQGQGHVTDSQDGNPKYYHLEHHGNQAVNHGYTDLQHPQEHYRGNSGYIAVLPGQQPPDYLTPVPAMPTNLKLSHPPAQQIKSTGSEKIYQEVQ